MKHAMKMYFVTAALLMATGGSAQTVTVKNNSKTDFAAFDYYAIPEGEMTFAGDEVKINKKALHDEIRQAVRDELELKGYQYSEDSTTGFMINYVFSVFNVSVNENLGPLGGRPVSTPGTADNSRYWTDASSKGLLVFEINLPGSTNILWSAECEIALSTDSNLTRQIRMAVGKAFKKFPRKGKR